RRRSSPPPDWRGHESTASPTPQDRKRRRSTITSAARTLSSTPSSPRSCSTPSPPAPRAPPRPPPTPAPPPAPPNATPLSRPTAPGRGPDRAPPPPPLDPPRETNRRDIAAIAQAQSDGHIPDRFSAVELLTIVLTLAAMWMSQTPELTDVLQRLSRAR